jgi:hypothetical protein
VTLLFQVLGVIAGGVALAALLGGGRTRFAPAGVAVVVVGVASLLFWTQVWPAGRALRDARKTNANVSRGDATRAPGSSAGANVGFLDWARGRMKPGETFYLAPAGTASDAFVYQWSTYQLLPHRHVPERGADWLVLYNVDPRTVHYDRSRYGRRVTYAPGLAVVRRTDAG